MTAGARRAPGPGLAAATGALAVTFSGTLLGSRLLRQDRPAVSWRLLPGDSRVIPGRGSGVESEPAGTHKSLSRNRTLNRPKVVQVDALQCVHLRVTSSCVTSRWQRFGVSAPNAKLRVGRHGWLPPGLSLALWPSPRGTAVSSQSPPLSPQATRAQQYPGSRSRIIAISFLVRRQQGI